MARNRPEERFAFNLVGRVLGAKVEPHDIGGRQGAVDALLHYPDGRRAALEVSSIGPQDEARILGFLEKGGERREISGLGRVWHVILPGTFRPRDLPIVDTLLVQCERLGFDSLMQGIGDDEIRALLQQGVNAEAIGLPAPACGWAFVHVREPGGWEGRGIQPLPDELATQLRTSGMRENIEKLAASGLDERHLFLMVRPSAFTFPVYDALSFGGPLPADPPRLPVGLSEVWLASTLIGGGVLRATADGTWRREPVTGSDRVTQTTFSNTDSREGAR